MIRGLGFLLMFARERAWNARRDHRTGWFLWFTAVAALGDACVALSAATTIALAFAVGGWPLAVTVGLGVVAVACPQLVVEYLLIRWGWPRAAWWLTLARFWGRPQGRGPAQLHAARALARRRAPDGGAGWLRARPRPWLTGDGIAAEAILAHVAGNADDARRLFLSLALVGDPAPEAREVASEWLALDGARRGDWAGIVARGLARVPPDGAHRPTVALGGSPTDRSDRPLWPATAMTFLLEGIAQRFAPTSEAPSATALYLRWLEAPRRRATWPLVRRALAARAMAAPAPAGEARPSASAPGAAGGDAANDASSCSAIDGDPLSVAVRHHVVALRAPTPTTIGQAASEWQRLFDRPGWPARVLQRAAILEAPPGSGDDAIAAVREQVIADLAELVVTAAIPLAAVGGPASSVLVAALARARRQLLDGFELALERVAARVEARQALPPIDEWRSFLAVHAHYHALVAQGGRELERLAFPHLHATLTAWTVWLWNQRHEYSLSHALTSWSYERALAVGDAEAIELHGRNGAVAPPRL